MMMVTSSDLRPSQKTVMHQHLSMIVAMSKNRVIGRDNQLPWHLPADLKHFKAVTMGKPIVMGRKTFESIGRPLPGRTNVVLTRDKHWTAEGVLVFSSIEDALKDLSDEEEVMVIGGSQIYTALLPKAGRLYLTEIDLIVTDGDAFFPELSSSEWKEVERVNHPALDSTPAHAFVKLDRVQTA